MTLTEIKNPDIYLLALGWWNLVGSVMMFGLYNENFGKNLLNKWTKIFKPDFRLDYWSRFWLIWIIGLNIFFALVNIYSVKWGYPEIKAFVITFDIIAYSVFIALGIWGLKTGKCGSGIYVAFIIFFTWIAWGLLTLTK